MRIERLFNVLVLGGAALSGGCSDADDEEKTTDALGGGDGGAASGTGGAEGAGGAAATGGTEGSGGAAAAGGAGALECGTGSNPAAPCGCPCCWAVDCTNEEPCCEAFCGLGNDGQGCCAP